MPFGLCNSPPTFQRLMDRIITPEMSPHVFCYLDDIIVESGAFQELLDWLDKVINRIEEAGLTINKKKCEFWCSDVKYLGFVVNSHGSSVDPDKVASVLNYLLRKT